MHIGKNSHSLGEFCPICTIRARPPAFAPDRPHSRPTARIRVQLPSFMPYFLF